MTVSVRPRHSSGFTLTELAVVLAIVGLLLGGAMYTLSAQTEQRNFEDTRRRIETARELVLAFAVLNGRLPCPARKTIPSGTETGIEARDPATGQCTSGGVEDYYGGLLTSGATGGFLPAKTIGFQQTDSDGFAVDVWGNRIRYAVAKTTLTTTSCTGTWTPHWVYADNMKKNGISCLPGDLLICKAAKDSTSTACASPTDQVTGSNLVVAIIFSTGKNGATGGTGADEAANLSATAGSANPVFVYHQPTSSDAAGGEFDDQFTWITAGELYGKLISAGVLP